jgi:polysaccharide export outer membrane protein
MKQTIVLMLAFVLIFAATLQAQESVRTRSNSADVVVDTSTYFPSTTRRAEVPTSTYGAFDVSNYTLGPSDVVEIEVLRHPEFSGRYLVNQEGKIQYKSVGDIEVKGLTKAQVADRLKEALAQYVVSPEINVSIIEYGSKVFYILGEVGLPGQFIMRAESISLRDAIHMAGLPTENAAMRRCELVTPSENGKSKIRSVNLYSLLYRGDLRKNIMIKPGDILYVPSTVMTKVIRTVSPVTTVFGITAAQAESSATARTAVESIRKKTAY